MKTYIWVHPRTYGQSVEQRLVWLWTYAGFYTGKNEPKTPARKRQLERYKSEIRFLESLDVAK